MQSELTISNVIPGMYWLSLPGWDKPPLVRVFQLEPDKLAVSFRQGEKPTVLGKLKSSVIFRPATVDPTMVNWVQKWHDLYHVISEYYNEVNLTPELCIAYLDRFQPLHEAGDSLRALRGKVKKA